MSNTEYGTVTDNLMRMRGVWRDAVQTFELDGRPQTFDGHSESPGASAYDNIVYIDFDGERMTQTNVSFGARAIAEKTFSAKIVDGVLVFDSVGEGAFENIGTSGGPGILVYNGRCVEDAWQRYLEPDFIYLLDHNRRLRTTVLYRNGQALRTLTAQGTRIAEDCSVRVSEDPRGPDGPVHGPPFKTDVWLR